MKVWRRCFSAVLAFIVFMTSVNFTEAAGTYDKENFIWTASDAEVVAGYYGLDELETAVLLNPSVDSGFEYTLFTPYDNETEGKKDLVAVDYVNQCVYAKALHINGFSWLPTEVILSAAGEEEMIPLTAGVCYYNEIEYYAKGAFTYSGNSYKVNVIYQLHLDISAEEQLRILEIPQILAQTANNLEVSFHDLEDDLADFIAMIPAFYEMLGVEYIEKAAAASELETTETAVPLFDPIEDEEVIASIQALYREYMDNGGDLILHNMREEYFSNYGGHSLTYAFEKGEQLQKQSESLLEHVFVLKDSNLSNKCNKLKDIDQELYTKVKNTRSVLRGMQGTVLKPGELALLADPANWRILDPSVRDRIFSDSYTSEEFASLEAAVYRLRNSKPEIPEIESETLFAAEIGAKCEIIYHEITVTVSAETVNGNLEDSSLKALEPVSVIVKLLENSTADEIRQAIENTGIERFALDAWNTLDAEYQINTSNYDREENGIPKALNSNVECRISYSPKMYRLKTNFGKSGNVPYGYKLELPKSVIEDTSYDYVVETEGGTKVSYNEGTTYKVTQPVTITQTEGAEKTEYRLYDFLISDSQYSMSDEIKQILASTALESPTLKIRIPDGSTVGEVMEKNGFYYIEAQNYDAGILGMTWVPHIAYVMNGNEELVKVTFDGNKATWTEEWFTHVNVSYRLKIEKVQNGILNRPLDETEDVLYALNLPHELVTHTVKQNQLLNGSEGVTAKTLYDQFISVAEMMTPDNLELLSTCMQTDEEKQAMLRLRKSHEKGGGWNIASDELALYTYLKLCAAAEWSLATYYEQGLYKEVAEQAAVFADCLEVITAAQGLWSMLELVPEYKAKMQKVVELLPDLRKLSESIEEPHPAIDMSDDGYEELITYLISMEGKTSAVETSDGIYAYASIRRNQSKVGALRVSVQVNGNVAKTKELVYNMESASHTLTEEEAQTIKEYIKELEEAFGLTEEEKVYYKEPISTGIPKAGDSVGKNEVVSLVYYPMEYIVTMSGVPEYEAAFKYKSNYVVPLPAYSDDTEAKSYYRYKIKADDEEYIKVSNGQSGYYTFTKEDLTTLFVNGHYEIYAREEVEMLPAVEISVEILPDDSLMRGYKAERIDSENVNLYLDVRPNGLTIDNFRKMAAFSAENGKEVIVGELDNSNIREPKNYEYLANGATVECIAKDKHGDEHTTTFTIIILGDINKSGKIDINDAQLIAKNYLGTAGEKEKIGDEITQYAADVNCNGNYKDSNDAHLLLKKINYWNSTSGDKKYESILGQ